MNTKSFNRGCRRDIAITTLGCLAAWVTLCAAVLPELLPSLWPLWPALTELAGLFGAKLPEMPPLEQSVAPALHDPLAILRSPLRGAYLASCSATGVAASSFAFRMALRTDRAFHSGTWVGGARSDSEAHGNARLVTRPREIRRRLNTWDGITAPQGGDLVAGSVGRRFACVDVAGAAAVLGQSGDGKSRRVAVETIALNVLAGNSLVVNDISGELERWTRGWVESLGTHEVHAVRFGSPWASEAIDPLARAKKALAARGAGACVSELRELARSIVPKSPRDQAIFPDGARNILVGVCLFVLTSQEVPDECRNMATVLACVSPTAEESSEQRLDALRSRLRDGDPSAPFLAVASGEGGGAAGMLNNLKAYLTAYVDDEVAPMLCASGGVDLDRVGEVPTVVFVSSTSATGDRSSLVNTVFSQALAALRSCASRSGGSCPVRTVLLMDEFASMGRCDRLLRDVAEMRKEGIAAVLFWQSFRQLEAVSGYSHEEARLLLDLCKHKVILSCGDVETAKALSEEMGDYTTEVEGRSQTRGGYSSTSGTSESLVRRPLISPSELMRWNPHDVGSLLIGGGRTIAMASRDVAETPLFKLLGMNDEGRQRDEQRRRLMGVDQLPAPHVWYVPEPRDVPVGDGIPADIGEVTYIPEGF